MSSQQNSPELEILDFFGFKEKELSPEIQQRLLEVFEKLQEEITSE